ncbi:MAG: hydantoinase/oxoprolinase family protein [Clostridiales bacterium]|nr:hydantoinase/oxoprolinase family protein [Clostridiales bacterium]
MKLGIGIDTGGTYTDAVIYNFENKAILGSAKSLTTKNDLTIGILGAIDGLPTDLVQQAEIISLSTTLATNACVEDKSGQAKLIFFGGEKKVIDAYGSQFGLPPTEEIYIQESYTKFSGEIEREPDWELFESQLDERFENLDGVGIIEMNAMRNGAVVEKKAKEIFERKFSVPVVCGHELFSELGCLQRGASTLLNAGLFPVITEFLTAVKKALSVRNIHPAAVVIVRSDGSLMSEEFSTLRPVETLLCGPAASAIGCTQLTDSPNSIVVDMGGTTTDIALIKDGMPVMVTDGVSIGKWKTFVNGLYVKTFGLGGDSAVHYEGKKLVLEDFRVIPLCIAAKEHPSLIEHLKNLKVRKHTHFLYEHYLLIKEIDDSPRYSKEEKAFCRALKNGPLLISDAAAAVGRDIYTLRTERLLKDGVIQLCGLTPTDIMHIKGDFTEYSVEASRLGANFAACNLGVSVEEFCDLVYDEVKRKLYLNIVKAILENKYPAYGKNGVSPEVEQFILETYQALKSGQTDPLLSTMFQTEYSLIGVGAPIGIFLKDVAGMLGTRAVIPENHEVANALGAIIGSVSASSTIEIKPNNTADGTSGYTVYGNTGRKIFEEMDDAMDFALSEVSEMAKSEAVRRGARGNLTLTPQIQVSEAEARDGVIYIGTTVTVHASGSAGF